MRDKYHQEMAQVHAPEELIEQTKQAMRREEERQTVRISKKRSYYISIGLAAVAAVLLLIFVPMIGNRMSSQKNELMLGQIPFSPDKITSEKEKKDGIKVNLIEEFPKDFFAEDAENTEVEKLPVILVKDERTGFYKAVFQCDSQKYLMISETVEREVIVEAVRDCIRSLTVRREE